ncbi:MAG: biopolymer transporter ExbD [Planctomycetes bacterium]|nr:biopolymer transporter ExbD [Planctomycetota bacterium]
MPVQINKGFVSGGINMTPMIDCVFLLLIFFLVATQFEEAERDMNVILPDASEAMPITARPKELFINVNQQGQFIVNGQHLNEQQLLGVLQKSSADNPGRQTVYIRADKRVPFEFVAAVMNLCNRAKIRDYRVTTAPVT